MRDLVIEVGVPEDAVPVRARHRRALGFTAAFLEERVMLIALGNQRHRYQRLRHPQRLPQRLPTSRKINSSTTAPIKALMISTTMPVPK